MTARGMIHGRFQPFHNGHLAYLRGAAARCDEVFVGITNPDPSRIKPEASDPLRHLPESNPYTYVERLLMVEAAALDAGLDLARVSSSSTRAPRRRSQGHRCARRCATAATGSAWFPPALPG